MDVLTWCQDLNWPVAPEIVEVVVAKQNLYPKLIREVLDGTDEVWKYWILSEIIPRFTEENLCTLMPRIRAIAKTPTDAEMREEVNMIAEEALATLSQRGID